LKRHEEKRSEEKRCETESDALEPRMNIPGVLCVCLHYEYAPRVLSTSTECRIVGTHVLCSQRGGLL
jgi:hypothetical protein